LEFLCFCGKLCLTMSLVGEHLRHAREQRGITILQAEMETRIRAAIIDALETGDYANLPPEPFLRGLLRTYATYLGLDSEQVLALYLVERTPPSAPLTATPAPPSPPETYTAAETPPPPAGAVRKPVPIRVPSLRPPLPRPQQRKPNLPEPPTPPESLATPNAAASTATRARLARRAAPVPMGLALGRGLLLFCVVLGLVLINQLASYVPAFLVASTATPTRLAPTRTPTLRPDMLPTPIPTLEATAPPAPSALTPTITTTPRATLETVNTLNLDVIQVTQPITLRIGIDGVLVFDAVLAPGATRSWSAKDSLYVFIENPRGATLELNGSSRWFAPRNFSETRALERYWNINERGTPVPMVPLTPVPLATPRATPTF